MTTHKSKLVIKRLDPRATAPTVANPGEDLAYDLYALDDTTLVPGTVTKVRTGIAAAAFLDIQEFDPDSSTIETTNERMGLLVRDRSSMASKGVFTHGGVIDAGYNGEIQVIMSYPKGERKVASTTYFDYPYEARYHIKAGDKIAQMVPTRVLTGTVEETDGELPSSSRGEAGFGSSGR